MSTFNKQSFEDKIYELATAEVNAVLPSLMSNSGDVLMFQRQLLQAFHWTIEEVLVQSIQGIRLFDQSQRTAAKDGEQC